MTFHGVVTEGKIALPDGVQLPEGTCVRVEVEPQESQGSRPAGPLTHREKLLALAGTIDGLPEDLSANLDHYLYGVPKR
jgi:hypothetical protein